MNVIIVFFVKWLHLLSIIGALGGIGFAAFVMIPAMRKYAVEEDHASHAMWRAFGLSQALFWTLILATGFYNVYAVSAAVNNTYQATLGIKIVLALIMFAIVMLLSHPAPIFLRFKNNRPLWLGVLVVLGIAVVGLSARLNLSRISGTGLKATGKSGGERGVGADAIR